MMSVPPPAHGVPDEALGVFGDLNAQARTEICDLCYPIAYRAGDLIHKAGMPAIGIFGIEHGLIKYGKAVADGLQPRTLRILGPGDLLGVEALFQAEATPTDRFARAITDVKAAFVPFTELQQFLERHPDALRGICEQFVRDIQRYECRLAEWTCDSVKVNLARLLLCLNERLGRASPEGWVLALSRRDLADLANAHVDTATRALAQLKDHGLIETGPHHITLRDEAGLAATAAPLPSCLQGCGAHFTNGIASSSHHG